MKPELIEQLLLESESAQGHPLPEGFADELWSKLEPQLPSSPDLSVTAQTDDVDDTVVLVDLTEVEQDRRWSARARGAAAAAVVVVVLGVTALLTRGDQPTTMVANDVADIWAAYVDSDRAAAQTCAVSWMLSVDVHFGVPGRLFEGPTDVPPFVIDSAVAHEWATGALAGVRLLEGAGNTEFVRLRSELEAVIRDAEAGGGVDVASAIAVGRADLPRIADLRPVCPLDESSGSSVASSLAVVRENGVSGPNRASRCVGSWLVADALNNESTAVVEDALSVLRSRYTDSQPPLELDELTTATDPEALWGELRERIGSAECPIR